jgi:redox-sensitive bicupin YhaK (pirin superfamily)
VKVLAGSADVDGKKVAGPIQGLTTEPLYLDVHLPAGASFTQSVPKAHNAFVYTYEGSVSVGGKQLPPQGAGVLSQGDEVTLTAGAEGARLILLAAKPLREPVVQYGPFVMNTREQIEQAIMDYQNGTLAQAA